jgi:phosphoglycerate dehydrogenase-like enzyme
VTRETVHIFDPIHPAGTARIEAAHELVGPDRLAEVTALVMRTSPLPFETLEAMPLLKLIVRHGAGYDNIPLDWCTARGIMVANTPGGNNSTAVAEGAVTLMLAVLRRVREMDAVVREGRWDERWALRLGDLTGASVGLIGFGRIARQVAQICGAGFGCNVLAHDTMIAAEVIRAAGTQAASLAEVMGCDAISIHVPLDETTRNLVGAAELALMPAHGVIVNTSRGGIIDEGALVEALAAGRIGGAGIDVFEAEPPPADHPLFALPNVVLSPHVAGVTEASMKGMALAVAAVIDQVAGGGVPATLINPAVLES